MSLNDSLKIFAGSSNPGLADAICKYLKVEAGNAKIERFPDGEKHIKLDDDVRGKDCFVIQSTCGPVDENLIELLIFIDCLKRASVKSVTAVVPYFGYARQDRKDEGRVPITAKLVANLLTTSGADRVLAVDLHAQQLQGFFDIPVDHLTAEVVLSDYFEKKNIEDLTVVSADVGNIKTASRFVSHLGGELAIIHKKRLSGTEVEATEIIGDVEGRNVVICDDIISTAGTICKAIELIRSRGAKKIYVGATHGVFAGDAISKLNAAGADEIVVTDTIPLNSKSKELKNIKVLSLSGLLGEAIKRIHLNESVSCLFQK